MRRNRFMDVIIEIIGYILADLLLDADGVTANSKLPKWAKILILSFAGLFYLAIFGLLGLCGIAMMKGTTAFKDAAFYGGLFFFLLDAGFLFMTARKFIKFKSSVKKGGEEKADAPNIIMNYRNKHKIAVVFSVCLAIALLIPFRFNEMSYVVSGIMTPLIALFIGSGSFQDADELVEKNIAKANRFTLIFSISAIIAFSLIGDSARAGVYSRISAVPTNIMLAAALFAIALRSILFLIYDRPEKISEEDE